LFERHITTHLTHLTIGSRRLVLEGLVVWRRLLVLEGLVVWRILTQVLPFMTPAVMVEAEIIGYVRGVGRLFTYLALLIALLRRLLALSYVLRVHLRSLGAYLFNVY
jgi:hypothetical protein